MVQRVQNSEAKRKGNYYGRGLALRSQMEGQAAKAADATTADIASSVRRQRTVPTKCKCGKIDHTRISFRKCELNPKNIALRAIAAEEAAKEKTDDNPHI